MPDVGRQVHGLRASTGRDDEADIQNRTARAEIRNNQTAGRTYTRETRSPDQRRIVSPEDESDSQAGVRSMADNQGSAVRAVVSAKLKKQSPENSGNFRASGMLGNQ